MPIELLRERHPGRGMDAPNHFLEEEIIGDLESAAVVSDQGGVEETDIDHPAFHVFRLQLNGVADLKGPLDEKQQSRGGVAQHAPDGNKPDCDHRKEGRKHRPESAELESEYAEHYDEGDAINQTANDFSHRQYIGVGEIGSARE